MNPNDYEGGFVQIRKKLWRGVIRIKEDERIIWTCQHNHSRPEFNARFELEDASYGIWETSALNCGRTAYRQFVAIGELDSVTGSVGPVGAPDIPVQLRPDTRAAYVGSEVYNGVVKLNDQGHRILTVSHMPFSDTSAKLNLDVSVKKGLTFTRDLNDTETAKLLTALWLLKGTIWGLTFHDHRNTLSVDGVNPEAIEMFLGKTKSREPKGLSLPTKPKETKKRTTPRTDSKYESMDDARIEVSVVSGRRKYEVVTSDGVVKKSFYQRGKAVAFLNKIRGKP